MKYSVQNSHGQKYGIYPMPESNQSPEVWAAELTGELADILGRDGVRDSALVRSADSTEKETRLIIDMLPTLNEEERLNRIHMTIWRLALEHTIALPT